MSKYTSVNQLKNPTVNLGSTYMDYPIQSRSFIFVQLISQPRRQRKTPIRLVNIQIGRNTYGYTEISANKFRYYIS